MWARLLAEILVRPWARRAAGYALVALAITLFILNIRRTAERTGRAAERLVRPKGPKPAMAGQNGP
jgi:hypothetical protein